MKRLLFALGLGLSAFALSSLLRGRASLGARTLRTPPPSYDEIALRAYFIGLDRETRGEPSAPLQDWQEAEHQLSTTRV